MTKVDLSAIRRIHILADAILVSIGWTGAYWLRFALNDTLGFPINSFDGYFRVLPLIVGPWMFSCWVFGIYRSTRMTTLVEEFQTLFRGAALGLLVVAVLLLMVLPLRMVTAAKVTALAQPPPGQT